MKSTSRSSKRKSKRSQKHSKMKTRSSREKPKKLKQQDHSVSGSSDGDDSIPKSVSSSSLVEENNNRIKKRGRSRDGRRRKDKKRRKRIRLLSDSSGDDSPIVKKVKKSKKSRGFDSRKKRNLKRRRRDRSVSSSSIHSLNDDGDGEFEGKEEKGEVKEQKRREKSKVRKRRRRDRSVSSSSSRSRGRSSEPNEDFEEKEEKVEVKERKGKEKGKKRKGRRRDHSISSSSSRSRSRYVYDENDNCERELEGKEEKLKLKEQKRRDKGKEMNARKRKGDMSRSCSPCSLHSESISYHSEERELEKNNPKRLKSVIVVMKESEVAEEQTSNRDDGHRDEIVCEFNDYPSKSNDSNDGVCGKESGSHSHHVSSEKRPLEEPNRKFVASDARVSEVTVVRKNDAEGSVGKSPCYVKSEADDLLMGNRSEASKSEVGLNHEDLETILRQKALENLLKRKGKLSTNFPTDTKGDHDIEMKKSSIVKAHPVDLCLLQDEENTKYMHKEEKHTDHVKFISNSHSPSRDSDGRLLSLEVETAYPDEKGKSPGIFVNSRPNVGISALRKEPLGAKNTWKRQLSLQEKSPKKFSPPREILANNSKQPLNSQEISLPNLSAPQEISMDSTSPRFVPKGSTEYATTVAASEPSASGEQHTNDKTNEADEKGQFQQKTMSVMRGGEMVQVSYKVYIPKKAPTLSRGKLKR